MSSQASPVKVFIRIRPTASFAHELIECPPDQQTLKVRSRKDSNKGKRNNQLSSWVFQLNGVLDNASQEDTYDRVARSVVLGAFAGYNGTIMCFGQTGAGKTYTMTGAAETYKHRGIIPRALQEVFQEVEHRADHTFSVHLSFLEIYNETMVDLLSSIKKEKSSNSGVLTVIEEPGGGVSVKGLSLHLVHNEEEALNLLFEGEMNRIIGQHALNKHSSRSHCIFTIHIEVISNEILSERQVEEVRSQVQRYLSGLLDEIPIVSITQIQEVFAQFKKVVLEQQKKLRERNPRVEKAMNTTPSTVAEGSVGAVGEVESCGYGLGLAKSSQKHQRNASPKPSKARKDKQIMSQPPVENTTVQAEQPLNITESDMTTHEPQQQAPEEQHRTDSPPPKTEAFEDFKAERGSEINRILKENKALLSERTTQLRILTDVINTTKRDLDYITYELRQFRERKQGQGEFVSAEGEPVLEEAELSLVMQLKELKNRYRQTYEDFRSTKTEVSYCQHLVNQCRTRLLTEFERWYNESFLFPGDVLSVLETGPVRPGHIPVDKALTLQSDGLPHKLHADSTASFYNAYNRTLKRRGSRQVSRSPESVRGSRSKTKLPILPVI
uniref:Kinesin family member 9 n=1 Tax=Cyprinus carpio TaxID=7962 RepID=A0A8C1VMK7_CYPCA